MQKSQLLDRIIFLFFFLYLITLHIFSYKSETVILSNITLLVLLALIILYIVIKSKLKIGIYFWLVFIFLLWALLTTFWAPNQQVTLSKATTIAQLCLVSFLLFNYFDSVEKIQRAIKIITYSYIILGLYTLLYYGIDDLFSGNVTQRIGSDISQENVLGMSLSFGTVMCFYYAFYEKRPIYYFYTLFLLVLSSFTGSRKALIISFLGILSLIYAKDRSRKITKTAAIFLLIGLVIYFILQLPYFENVLSRMQEFINLLMGQGKTDSSSVVRASMVSFGWDLFENKPIIGYGFDSFRYYWGDISKATYSHNNYIEMLVNGGLVALLIYYSIYAYSFIKLGAMAYKFDKIAILLTILILIQLVIDNAAVSYYFKITYLNFALFYSYIRVKNSPIS